MSNKVISAVNTLIENVNISDINQCVCIDTQNNRIGIGTASPNYAIEVSGGTIKTHGLSGNIIDSSSINTNTINTNTINTLDNLFLSITSDISCNDISCNDISSNHIFCSSLDISNININNNIINFTNSNGGISSPDIIFNTISGNTLNINNIIGNELSFNDMSGLNLYLDSSLNVAGDISCNTLRVKNIIFDGSNIDLSNGQEATLGYSSSSTSDDRLKHNEVFINNGLNIVNQLKPQIYQKTETFKHPDFSGIVNEPYKLEAGLIAQEVLEIDDLSYCVTIGDENNPYLLNYNNILVYGLSAIQELDTKIEHLNNSIHDSNNNPNLNLTTINNIITNQNKLIQTLSQRINLLENQIKSL